MRRLNLLYLAGLVVIALCMANPNPASAALYGDYLSTISTGNLNQPAKVAVDQANGDVYVTDAGNKQVKKFDKNGNYAATFTLTVAGTPVGIAVNANNIFVGDSTNKCVWIYDKNGNLADLSGTGTSHKLGGASGTAVKMPNTVVVAPSGHIFVADGDSDDCLIYNADGTYNSSFGTSGSGLSTGTTIYCYFPSGIAMANNSVSGTSVTQYFYMGDQGNYRVQKLHYIYNSSTKAITTAPTFDQNIGSGTRADAFGSFLRLSDVVCDNTGRLIALDSLQMVGQIFQSDALYTNTSNQCKDASNNVAINYCTSAVVGNLNVPTGAAVYMGDASTTPKLYVANNQNNNIVVYNTQDGAIPTLQITDPATTAVVPCTATYNVTFSGTDADSTTETVKLYYYNTAYPSVKTLFSTQVVTVTQPGGSFTGQATLDLVGTYPNYLVAGTYGIYGEVTDEKSNLGTADSGAGTIGITNVAGEGNYTCSMAAKWGDGLTTDTDGDGISNADEINGTHNGLYGNAPTDPANVDTDGDGLDDGVEEGVKAINLNIPIPLASTSTLATPSNPNNKDTDNGGVSDAVEVEKGTDPTNIVDDLNSAQDGTLACFPGSASNRTASLSVMNVSASPVIADLTFLNSGGAVVAGAKALRVLPNQRVLINPKDFGVDTGAVELRATGGVRGNLESIRMDAVDPTMIDDTYGRPFARTSVSHAYGDTFCDYDSWRFLNTFYLYNPNSTSVTVTGKWYDTTAGASVAGTLTATGTYVIPAHGYVIIRPRTEVPSTLSWGYVDFSCVSGSFSGYQVRERFNATNSNIIDIDFAFNLDDTLKNTAYMDTYCDYASWRFINYIYMLNPADTPSNVTINYFDSLGNPIATKNYAIQPHTVEYHRVSSDVGTTVDWGGAQITADGSGIVGFQQRYRWNVNDQNLYDFGYAWTLGTSSSSYLYLPAYKDNQDRYISYLYMRNDAATATTATVQYFDTNGNLGYTDNISIPVNQILYYRPSSKGTPTAGSIKITITSGSMTGYMLQEITNVNNSAVVDGGSGIELVP